MAYFSVGDTVHIRHDIAERDDDGEFMRYYMQDRRISNSVTADMVMMAGKEVVIRRVGNQYNLENIPHYWTDEMFEEYVRPDMEIDVDDNDVDVLLE